MRLDVEGEGDLALERLTALRTLERTIAAVDEHVAIELRGGAEAPLLADQAMVRLLLGVATFVGNQIARIAKGTSADITFVRLLAGVGEHVLLVARLLGETLPTDPALERLDAAVGQQVGAQ